MQEKVKYTVYLYVQAQLDLIILVRMAPAFFMRKNVIYKQVHVNVNLQTFNYQRQFHSFVLFIKRSFMQS